MKNQITLIRSTSILGVNEILSEEIFDSFDGLFGALKNKYSLPVTDSNEKAIAEHPYTEFRVNELINSGDAAASGNVTYSITIS